MITINFLRHFVETYAIGAYMLVYIGVILEGEIVVIIAGIFAHLGSLHFLPAFLVIFAAGVSKSFLAYGIGRHFEQHHRHKGLVQRMENRISYFLPRFQEKPFWSIFISRFFLFGIGWVTLMFSGYKKIPFRTYMRAELSSLVIWGLGVLSVGYFFSYTALSISRDVRKFLLIIFLCFIAFFLLRKIIAFVLELSTGNGGNKEKE